MSRAGRDDITLSAALLAQAATSHRVMEWSGQYYGELAERLDAIMPMAYFKEEQRPADWISDVIFAARALVGQVPIHTGIPAYKNPDVYDYTLPEFEKAVRLAQHGSDGLVAYAYLPLFSRGNDVTDMPMGAAQIFQNALVGRDQASDGTRTEQPGPPPVLAGAASVTSQLLLSQYGLAGLAALVLFGTVTATLGARRRTRKLDETQPSRQQRPVANWRELEVRLRGDDTTGSDAAAISAFLRQYDARAVSSFRMAFVLEAVSEGNDPFDWIGRRLRDIPGWRLLALRFIEEAHLHGYVSLQDDVHTLTAEGSRALARSREAGYDADLWRFVERRLHEVLAVTCSGCGAENLSHWFWETFDCADCGRHASIADVAGIELRPTDVTTKAYISL